MNMNINMQSGHKRVISSNNPPFSGQKLGPRNTIVNLPLNSGAKKSGSREYIQQPKLPMNSTASGAKNRTGSILFGSLPIKFEGDLNITKSRDNSKNTRDSNNNLNKSEIRSYTPNKSTSARGFGNLSNLNFKSNPMKNNNGSHVNLNLPLSKVKRLNLSPNNAKEKPMIKKTQSYYIPKSARDTLNLSNISKVNNSRLNDTNNSFVTSDLMNKNRLAGNSKSSFSRNPNINLNIRSNTPNARTKSANKLGDDKFTKSNTDLNKFAKKPLSKSPNNNLSRLSKNISIGKINQGTPNSKKNPFDSTLMKQLNDFKNNKGATPQILKKLTNPKLMNITSSKFGSGNMKKVVTGNLISMNSSSNAKDNNNINDVSTNSTFVSKDNADRNVNLYTNNGTNNSNVIVNVNINLNKKESNEVSSKKGLTINNNYNNRKEEKDQVNFREITTSPLLLRKKQEHIEDKDEGLLSGTLFNKLTSNTNNNNTKVNTGPPTHTSNVSSNVTGPNNSNIVSNLIVNNTPQVVRKNIQLIHEFSKVGYSGYGVKKVNQDNYFVFKNFVNNPNHYYMAVCDGHGVLGHEVSGYLRENLPTTLNNQLKSKNKNVLLHNINSIISDVFLEQNYKLHTNEIMDTTFSGSTCVSLIYTPEKVITANVGDSRAVLGRCVNGEWISHDLTRDHKPDMKDESARIKKRGGRIQPFKDDDGEFIGPARVWLRDDEIPGLAMSRSFGDRVASSVGVIAEPEIFEYKFQENDKFFIIASDGVWEFIESPECVNIIKEFYLKNDIVGCCEYLHKESSTRWMKEEEVIDDISMIIVFLD